MTDTKQKMAPAERRVHLDFHTPDFVTNVGAKLEAEKFSEILAKAEVEQAAFFAKCHYGNAYYPTAIGRRHPGLQCDMLGQFTEAATRHGVRTFAYYSLQLDVWYGTEHPETVQHPEPFAERCCGSWTPVCVAGTYGDYAREQLKEIVSAYDVAGIWMDIVGYYPFCTCQDCRETYQRDINGELPFSDKDADKGVGTDFLDWQRRMLDRYTDELVGMIDALRPGCVLLCNTASGIREKAGGETNQRDGEWCEEGVGNRGVSLTSVSLYSSFFDGAAAPRPFEILTQRFHMGWGDWTLRPFHELAYDASTILAHGGLVSIGDQLYGDGSFEPLVYKRIGEAFKWLKPRQEFCGYTVNAAEVAVFSEPGGFRRDPGAIKYDSIDCRNSEGLFKLLLDAHVPSVVLSRLNGLDGDRHAVLLVDHNLPDTEDDLKALTEFVEAGGHLIAVGIGPERYWPLLGVQEAKDLATSVSYIRMANPSMEDLAMPVLARIQGQGVTLDPEAEVLGCWAHPMCEKTKTTFYSHQHAPAGPVTDEPSIWRVERGAGGVMGIGAPLATDYWHTSYSPLRRIVLSCLDHALKDRRQIYSEGLSANAEVTLRIQGQALFAHVVVPGLSRPGLSATGETFFMDDAIDLHGVRLALRIPEGRTCEQANQLGEALEVQSGSRDGYVQIALRPFRVHTVVRFKLA